MGTGENGHYDAKMGTSGANGSIRHWDILKYVPYSEMAKALRICDRLSKFHQMGLTDEKDIVSLIEGLTLGKAYRESLELEKTSSAAPVVFDNSYFVNLMTRDIDNVALVDHTFGKLPDHLLIEIFIRVPVLDWPHINCVKQQWGRFL